MVRPIEELVKSEFSSVFWEDLEPLIEPFYGCGFYYNVSPGFAEADPYYRLLDEHGKVLKSGAESYAAFVNLIQDYLDETYELPEKQVTEIFLELDF